MWRQVSTLQNSITAGITAFLPRVLERLHPKVWLARRVDMLDNLDQVKIKSPFKDYRFSFLSFSLEIEEEDNHKPYYVSLAHTSPAHSSTP